MEVERGPSDAKYRPSLRQPTVRRPFHPPSGRSCSRPSVSCGLWVGRPRALPGGFLRWRSSRMCSRRTVTATRSPRANSFSVMTRPNPDEAPVMNQALLMLKPLRVSMQRSRWGYVPTLSELRALAVAAGYRMAGSLPCAGFLFRRYSDPNIKLRSSGAVRGRRETCPSPR
jgi:hypothetical protein